MSKIVKALSNILLRLLIDEEKMFSNISKDFETAWMEAISQFEHTVFDEDSTTYKMCKRFYFKGRIRGELLNKSYFHKLKGYLEEE